MVNGENAMAMSSMDKFKRHVSGAFHRIFVTAGRAETAMATKGEKLEFAAMRTPIHGTTKRWIATVEHFVYVFNNRFTWM